MVWRNAIDFTGKGLEYIMPSMTMNPAKPIGLHERKGSIEEGKDADFVVLDKSLAVHATFVKGNCVFQRSEVEL
jgi:N-acetylglucosamine-6-phosphate deacetylase